MSEQAKITKEYTAKELLAQLRTGKVQIDNDKDYTLYSYDSTIESQTPMFIVKGSDIEALIEKLREYASTETPNCDPQWVIKEGIEYSLAIRLIYPPRRKVDIAFKYDSEQKDGFKTLSIQDQYGRGATIITSQKGGLFFWNKSKNAYELIQGTEQFKITSEEQAKIELQAKYEENLFKLEDYFYTEDSHIDIKSRGIRIKAQNEAQAKRIALDLRYFEDYVLKLGTLQSMNKGYLTAELWRCDPYSNQWHSTKENHMNYITKSQPAKELIEAIEEEVIKIDDNVKYTILGDSDPQSDYFPLTDVTGKKELLEQLKIYAEEDEKNPQEAINYIIACEE